jgi:hypothetical protein
VFDERVPASEVLAHAADRARRYADLPPHAFATTKRELRARSLERIAAARVGQGEPRLAAWLGEETKRASAAVLRAAASVRRTVLQA